MGQDQSTSSSNHHHSHQQRAPGFEFLDSGRLQPRVGNITTTTRPTTTTRSSNNSAASSSSAPEDTSQNHSDSGGGSNASSSSRTSSARASSTGARSNSSSSNLHRHHHHITRRHQQRSTLQDDHQMFTAASSADVNNNTDHITIQDRAVTHEQRQDERRMHLMFQMMKMCQQELEKEMNKNSVNDDENEKKFPFPSYEADSIRWSVCSLLRACRVCGEYCPKFRNATLTGSQPALVFLCDDCAALGGCPASSSSSSSFVSTSSSSSSLETVNATADSVAGAIARIPGFHGAVVTGTWQIQVVNHFEAMIGNSSSVLDAPRQHQRAVGSAERDSSFRATYYANHSSSNTIATETKTSSSSSKRHHHHHDALSLSESLNNASSSSVRYLVNALLYGHGPVSVHQGVSGTAVETCAFASVLPGLEFISLSTTCNQRESDLGFVKRVFRDRPNLQLSFEGRSFDDKSLMFMSSKPFRQNITHLSVKHCDRITSAGMKLIATCFPSLKAINFRGSSNIDLDVFQEPITEESANVLALLVEDQQQHQHQQQQPQPSLLRPKPNPLCYSLESLDFSESALQFETRIGVFGRLMNLRELNLGGCENIHDSGFIDMMRQAVWCITSGGNQDDHHEIGLFPCQPPSAEAFLSLPSSSSQVFLLNKPLQSRDLEYFQSLYEQFVVSNNGYSCFIAPSFTWLKKLNLSGLRHLTDESIRFLCGSWMSPEEYQRLLLTLSDESISYSKVVPYFNPAAAAAAATVPGQQRTQHQQDKPKPHDFSIISAFAEKLCLIKSRDSQMRDEPKLRELQERLMMKKRSGNGNNAFGDDGQTEEDRRIALLLSPRSTRNENAMNNSVTNQEEEEDERSVAVGETPRNLQSNFTGASSSVFFEEATTMTEGGATTTTQVPQNEADADENINSSPKKTHQLKSCKNNSTKPLPGDHQRSAVFERIGKELAKMNTTEDEGGFHSSSSSLITSWLSPSLTELSLADCTSLTPISFAMILTSFTNMQVLDLRGNPQGVVDEVLEFATSFSSSSSSSLIRNLYHLRSFNITRCDQISVGAICRFLRKVPSITEFYCSPRLQDCDENVDDEETTQNADQNAKNIVQEAEQLRFVSRRQLRVLGLQHPDFALSFLKVLAKEARRSRNLITYCENRRNNDDDDDDEDDQNEDERREENSSSSFSVLQSLLVPSSMKLAEAEARFIKKQASIKKDRMIYDEASLMRMATTSVHHLMREATHQVNRDLEIREVY